MKRMIVPAVLVWALLSSVAWAGGGFQNERGSVSISNSGIVPKGSQLVFCNGLMAAKGHSLGLVSFLTGGLTSGTGQEGGTFSATGSSFTVIGRCEKVERRGVIFSGSFDGPITWTLVSQTHSKLVFALAGHIIGINHKGRKVGANMTQTIITTKGQLAQGIGHITSGVVVPDT